MSCYLVQPEVIQAIVIWGTQPGRLVINRNYLARVLAQANIRACEARYPDILDGAAAHFTRLSSNVEYYEAVQADLAEALPSSKQVQCLLSEYAYQACDMLGWGSSEAHSIIEQLKAYAAA